MSAIPNMTPTHQIQQLRARAEAGEAKSQFLLSQFCFQNKDIEGMIHWLGLASANGLPVAQEAMGYCYEKGRGISKNFNEAVTHYDRAIEKGARLAAYRKAELLYKSHQGPANENIIRQLLVTAADADVVPALRAIGYLAMQDESTAELAVHCLGRAAQTGDPASCFNLGWYLQQKSDDRQSHSEAAYWLHRAAAAKYPFADNMLASLQEVLATTPPPIAQNKIKLEKSFPLYPTSQANDSQEISADPSIRLFKNVLTKADRAYLIFLSRPFLKRADVIDPNGSKEGQVSSVRTNMSTFLPFGIVDIISRYAELKIVHETGEDLAFSEPMSILYYSPGEQYHPHVDYFNPNLNVSKELLADGGQRTASAITYLDAPFEGGGTSFTKLGILVPPVAGSTLWFRNCLDDGQPDPRSLHAGDPIVRGEKWVVTKWFREKPTRYLEF